MATEVRDGERDGRGVAEYRGNGWSPDSHPGMAPTRVAYPPASESNPAQDDGCVGERTEMLPSEAPSLPRKLRGPSGPTERRGPTVLS